MQLGSYCEPVDEGSTTDSQLVTGGQLRQPGEIDWTLYRQISDIILTKF